MDLRPKETRMDISGPTDMIKKVCWCCTGFGCPTDTRTDKYDDGVASMLQWLSNDDVALDGVALN
jgi:hypothetical protein